MITGAQVRAAKALIRWSGSDLSEQAGVSISSIRRIEACDGLPDATSVKVLHAIQSALEAAGIEFVGTAEDRPGVRLMSHQPKQESLFAKQTP
jgi:transcriptional regulator with XRE-family HTH domain